MFVVFNDILVYHVNMGFSAAIETSQQTTPIDEVIIGTHPQGQGGELLVVPSEVASVRVVMLVCKGLGVKA
jgi:hypothetical protein